MCLINTHIFTYVHARCHCKLWNTILSYCIFFLKIFIYIIDEYSSLKYCTFPKLSQIVYLIYVHILVSQYVRYDCRLREVLWFNCFFVNFHTEFNATLMFKIYVYQTYTNFVSNSNHWTYNIFNRKLQMFYIIHANDYPQILN